MTQPQQHYDVTDDDFDFIWKNIDSPLVVRDRINVIKTRSNSYQSERDKVLGDEHYRNALSLCDNLLVHLEDNDITYLQIKKTVALVKKELQKFRQAGEP